jgi:hypothetical protein
MGDHKNKLKELIVMENNYDLTDLTENELKERSGGFFPVLLIKIFVPTIDGILGFRDGLREGFIRTTPV